MSELIFFESSLRSFFIALFCLFIGAFINKEINKNPHALKWCLLPLFICFFIPPVAVAYGYSNLSFRLVQHQFLLQSLYVFIIICRLTAPVTIFLLFIPQSLSKEGYYCYKLTRSLGFDKADIFQHLLFILKGCLWRYLVAFIMVFMLAFSEFEIASLLNVGNWYVSVFDSYAQGITNKAVLRLHAMPFILQSIILIVFISLIPNLQNIELPQCIKTFSTSDKKISNSNLFRISTYFKNADFLILFIIIILFLFAGFIYPSYIIIKSAIPGMPVLFKEFWMFKELLSSLLFAFSATLIAYIISIAFTGKKNKIKKFFMFIVFIPALIGILPVSLLILQIFQLPFLNKFYDTPLPLLTSLIIWCLPFVFMSQVVLNSFTGNESIHTARLLLYFSKNNAMDLLWRYKFRGVLWIFFFVFTLTYFDLTASAILSPASMTTITARFYNLMHYGESEKLSATVCLSLIVPLLVLGVAGFLFKTIIKKWNVFSKSD